MAKVEKQSLEEITQDTVAISRRKLGGEAPIVVNEVVEGCLLTGMFGTLDSARMKSVVDLVLTVASTTETDIIIFDLSNIDVVDSVIAGQLVRINKTLQIVGMEVIFCGIKPIVAQSIVSAGIELENVFVVKNLKSAVREVYKRRGLHLVKIDK
ncbi:MAG: STAS domain-containing protein [Reichenbachiella sp.]|uniref:STAS domain-containing protein n=1 Tax=Reichenbachiella sp. TaxID=2184521 RepID=UPI0032632637